MLRKKTSGHFASPHHVYAGAAGYEIINLSLHRPAYQWSNEEARFFWALIYDLVESVSDGWDLARVAGGVGLHMRKGVKHIFVYLYSLNMQRSRMQSMVCWTDSAGGKVAELKMFGFS